MVTSIQIEQLRCPRFSFWEPQELHFMIPLYVKWLTQVSLGTTWIIHLMLSQRTSPYSLARENFPCSFGVRSHSSRIPLKNLRTALIEWSSSWPLHSSAENKLLWNKDPSVETGTNLSYNFKQTYWPPQNNERWMYCCLSHQFLRNFRPWLGHVFHTEIHETLAAPRWAEKSAELYVVIEFANLFLHWVEEGGRCPEQHADAGSSRLLKRPSTLCTPGALKSSYRTLRNVSRTSPLMFCLNTELGRRKWVVVHVHTIISQTVCSSDCLKPCERRHYSIA